MTGLSQRTFSVAVGAHGLHLLHHAGSQLPDHDTDTSAPASVTFLNGSSLPSLPGIESTSCMKSSFFQKHTTTTKKCISRLTCLIALPIIIRFSPPHIPPTKPLNSYSSINSITQVQQFSSLRAGSRHSNTDRSDVGDAL